MATSMVSTDSSGRTHPGQFERLKVVGQGSFGKVFLVRKCGGSDCGSFYAMKVFNKNDLKVRDMHRTNVERDILARVDHPFIVRLHYAFQTPAKLYLVMDFLRGGDLFSKLSKGAVFSENVSAFYLGGMLLALEYLHSLGIVYRDLKPENVLLDAEGYAVLTDFGLSKEHLEADQKTFSFCGTIEYMAPEVIKRRGHSFAADWWSFGILTFQMLTGNIPFVGSDTSNRHIIMKSILKNKLSLPPHMSPGAHNILRRLLQKDPQRRLGHEPRGAMEIRDHSFFAHVNWRKLLLRQVPPPFRPAFSASDHLACHFDDEFTTQAPLDSHADPLSPTRQEIFKEFDFVSPNFSQKANEGSLCSNSSESMESFR